MPHQQLPDESSSEVEAQIAALIAKGYKREDLWVSASGRVLIDQDAGALEAHNRVFRPEEGMTGLWETISRQIGLGRRGGLRWQRLEDAKQTEFFRWFSFAEIGAAKDESGNSIISFRPDGDKFHNLVKLDMVVGEQKRIIALRLFLTRSFVGHERTEFSPAILPRVSCVGQCPNPIRTRLRRWPTRSNGGITSRLLLVRLTTGRRCRP